MATAMIDWDEDQEQELTAPMETPASARLVESHHQELSAEIERAKSMVGQSEIDGEVIYSQHTLDRAVAFLKMHVEWLWRTCGIYAHVPMIGPGPSGSVDLFWRQPSWKLLVYGVQKTKGTLDITKFSHNIAACLMD